MLIFGVDRAHSSSIAVLDTSPEAAVSGAATAIYWLSDSAARLIWSIRGISQVMFCIALVMEDSLFERPQTAAR